MIDGRNIYDKSVQVDELRKSVGMVFQRPNPFPKSIFENVAYGLRVNGVKDNEFIRHRVEETLKGAALWDEVKNKLKESAFALSGGQQQRLCIARAMAVSPSVLLMDEPASALDPISTAKVEELIHELKKEYTIVIVTHNMQQAARCSDHTAFMYLGELIEFSNTDDLFTKPAKKQTEDYITGRTVDSGVRYGQSQSYKHISGQFNAELESIRTQVMTMGGMVEQQLSDAITAMHNQDSDLAKRVIEGDKNVNMMEVAIDEACVRIIAKRQPTASDLRLVMVISENHCRAGAYW